MGYIVYIYLISDLIQIPVNLNNSCLIKNFQKQSLNNYLSLKKIIPVAIDFEHTCFMSSLAEIGQVVLKNKILNVTNKFSIFHYHFSLEKDMTILIPFT